MLHLDAGLCTVIGLSQGQLFSNLNAVSHKRMDEPFLHAEMNTNLDLPVNNFVLLKEASTGGLRETMSRYGTSTRVFKE
jgi:hypothetical protein